MARPSWFSPISWTCRTRWRTGQVMILGLALVRLASAEAQERRVKATPQLDASATRQVASETQPATWYDMVLDASVDAVVVVDPARVGTLRFRSLIALPGESSAWTPWAERTSGPVLAASTVWLGPDGLSIVRETWWAARLRHANADSPDAVMTQRTVTEEDRPGALVPSASPSIETSPTPPRSTRPAEATASLVEPLTRSLWQSGVESGRRLEASVRNGVVRVGPRGTAALLDGPSWTGHGRLWERDLASLDGATVGLAVRMPTGQALDGWANVVQELLRQERADLTEHLATIEAFRLGVWTGGDQDRIVLTVRWRDRVGEEALLDLARALHGTYRDELPLATAWLSTATVTSEPGATHWTWNATGEGRDRVAAVAGEVQTTFGSPPPSEPVPVPVP